MMIDPGLESFLADPRNEVRRPPAHVSLEKIRQAANAAMIGDPGPDLHAVDDMSARLVGRDLALRLYRPSGSPLASLILFAHGGGWVWGNLDTHDAICRRLAKASGSALIAVDYRLAPETGRRGQIADVFDALQWVRAQAEGLGLDAGRIALCGDSAGGALALEAAIRARDAGLPVQHLAMIYPPLDPTCDSVSQAEFGQGYMLTRDAMRWFWECHLGPSASAPDHRTDAGSARFAELPPVTVAVAEFDILRHEGEDFARRLAEAGVAVRLHRYAGMIHGFLSVAAAGPTAARAIEEIAADIARSLDGQRREAVSP